MGFESPGSFAWAALAVVVAALYLWNFARRRQEVATFALWQRALARRPAWFAMRFWLSLLAQIVILLLLVAALAQPFWKHVAAGRRSMVLILDVSASMSATDVEPSRFDQMIRDARRLIENLQRGEQMAILAAGTTIRPVSRLGESRESLLAACDALRPTDGATRIGDAVTVAREVLRGQPNPQIIVLTDGGFPEAAALRDQDHVRLIRFGQAPANAGITQFAAQPGRSDPGRFDVSVEVLNGGTQPLAVPLHVGVRGGESETVDLQLAPGESVRKELTIASAVSGLLDATLEIDDDLAADNVASLHIHGRGPTPVELIARPSEVSAAIRTALETVQAIRLETAEQLPSQFDPETMYVLHREVPPELPAGRFVVLDPQSESDLWRIAGTLEGSDCSVASTALDADLLTGVDLEGIVFERASRLEFRTASRALAVTTTGDAICTLVDRPEGPLLVFHVALDREHSDFLLRPDFARFLQNAVRHLAADPPNAASDRKTCDLVRLAPGETIRRLSASDAPLAEQSAGPLAVLDHVGNWEIARADRSADDSLATLVTSSLLAAAESTLAVPKSVSSGELPLAEPVSDQPVWMLLVGFAVVLLILEWCLYHWRIVV